MYYNSNLVLGSSSDTCYSTDLTAALLCSLPCDVIRRGCPAWLAQKILATSCCSSFLGEEGGSRHLCPPGDLLGICIAWVEQAGCTAVVVVVGQSSGTTVWAVFKTLGCLLMSTSLNLNSNSTKVNALVSSCVT